MKKKIFIILGGLFLLIIIWFAYAFLTTRSHSPAATASISDQGLDINVTYCRPFKKGRLIFGDASEKPLLAYGKYWRLGANDATQITFSKNVKFAGQPVNAGTYRMYAVPKKDTWQISLNSEVGKFGAFEPDYKLDVVKVDVPVTSGTPTEQLTITLAKGESSDNLNINWDQAQVVVPITSN